MINPLLEHKQIIHLVKYKWVWLLLSIFLVVPGLIAMVYSSITYPNHYPLKVGIDFTGGTIVQYASKDKITTDQVSNLRLKLKQNGIDAASIQLIDANNTGSTDSSIKSLISIRTKFIGENDNNKLQNITKSVDSEIEGAKLIQTSSIGPTLGKELFKNSLAAVLLAFLGIVIYLTIRFQFDYAVIALLSLVHDALFILGIFSIFGLVFGMEVDSLFITAVLTVLGFSVHDTIVVFDRIRENNRFFGKKKSFPEIVDISVNQTLARSINTSVTTLLTLIALYVFGGVTTKDFVLAMILGIMIGTYSSIFFASTVLAWERGKKKVEA